MAAFTCFCWNKPRGRLHDLQAKKKVNFVYHPPWPEAFYYASLLRRGPGERGLTSQTVAPSVAANGSSGKAQHVKRTDQSEADEYEEEEGTDLMITGVADGVGGIT